MAKWIVVVAMLAVAGCQKSAVDEGEIARLQLTATVNRVDYLNRAIVFHKGNVTIIASEYDTANSDVKAGDSVMVVGSISSASEIGGTVYLSVRDAKVIPTLEEVK